MGDREYRPWILKHLEITESYWTLNCYDEANELHMIRVHKSPRSAKWLSEIIGKSYHEWVAERELCDLNIPIEAVICVWEAPEEIAGQEEFRGFRINGKIYFFELSYSIFC